MSDARISTFQGGGISGLGDGHVEGQRIAQVVVGQRVADQHGQGVGFLAGRAAGAPDAQSPIAALLFVDENSSRTSFWKSSSCGRLRKKLVSLTVRFSSSAVSSFLPFAAGQQPVVAVERIELAGLQAALQAIAQKMRAALVEIHAAFLINQRLQELQFRFGQRDLRQ